MKNYIVSVLLSIAVLLVELIFLNGDYYLTRLLEFQLIVSWLIIQYRSIKKFGLFSLYSLCMIGFFIFSIGAVFHYLLSGDDIRILERGFGYFKFSYLTIQESLWVYTVFIVLSYFTYNYLYTLNKHHKIKNDLTPSPILFDSGRCIMWLFLVVEIYKGYLYFNAFNADRVQIFLLGNMANPVPGWVRFLSTFFQVGYYLILASIPTPSEFKKYSILYFVAIIPEILLGNRSMFGAFLLFYMWYYYKFYNKQAISTRTAIIGGICMLIIFQLMEFIRDGASYSLSSFSITKFLVSQGVSFYILPIYIDNMDHIQFYLYPFILYNIIGGFTGYTGQSIDVLKHNCGVGHQLMYTVDPDYYLAGASFGSSSIVEVYDTGIIGLIIFSIFFSYMLMFFERRFKSNRFFCFCCMIIVTHFVLSARGSYFPQMYALVKFFIFYKIISWLIKMVVKKKASFLSV